MFTFTFVYIFICENNILDFAHMKSDCDVFSAQVQLQTVLVC